MGSRGRSIRLRIYFLVAIPLIAMVGLLGYVVTTTVNNAVSLDRAPNLVNATAVPAAKFGIFVQAERTAAVVYLFQPSPANLQAYQAAIAATDKAKPAFTAAMTSEATIKHRDSRRGQDHPRHRHRPEPAPHAPQRGPGAGHHPDRRARLLQPGPRRTRSSCS